MTVASDGLTVRAPPLVSYPYSLPPVDRPCSASIRILSLTRWLALRRSDAPAHDFMNSWTSSISVSSESSLSSRYDHTRTPESLSPCSRASVLMVSRPRRLCSETTSAPSLCLPLTASSNLLRPGRFLNSAPLTPSSLNTYRSSNVQPFCFANSLARCACRATLFASAALSPSSVDFLRYAPHTVAILLRLPPPS